MSAELGVQVRRALWRFATTTRLTSKARDRAGISLVKNRHPKAMAAFPEAAILAVLREPQGGTCSWDALRVLTAAGPEPMPAKPTPELVALLGKPCQKCQTAFEAGRVARRERAMLAAASGPSPTGLIWAAHDKEAAALVASAREAARRSTPPSYYRPGRPR
jgi:hypothetical protein